MTTDGVSEPSAVASVPTMADSLDPQILIAIHEACRRADAAEELVYQLWSRVSYLEHANEQHVANLQISNANWLRSLQYQHRLLKDHRNIEPVVRENLVLKQQIRGLLARFQEASEEQIPHHEPNKESLIDLVDNPNEGNPSGDLIYDDGKA